MLKIIYCKLTILTGQLCSPAAKPLSLSNVIGCVGAPYSLPKRWRGSSHEYGDTNCCIGDIYYCFISLQSPGEHLFLWKARPRESGWRTRWRGPAITHVSPVAWPIAAQCPVPSRWRQHSHKTLAFRWSTIMLQFTKPKKSVLLKEPSCTLLTVGLKLSQALVSFHATITCRFIFSSSYSPQNYEQSSRFQLLPLPRP